MIYLAGDCVFMESLSKSAVNHRFHVGPSSVILRGGIRKPAFLSEQARAQFTWFRQPLQPVQGLAPTSSEEPAELSRSLSTSSGVGPSLGSSEVPSTSAGLGRRRSGRKSPKRTACSVPSCSSPAQKKPSARPLNRSARLKAKAAKNKSSC